MEDRITISASNIVALQSDFFNSKKKKQIEQSCEDAKIFQHVNLINYIEEKDLRKYSRTPKSFRFYSLSTKMAIASMNLAIKNMEIKNQDRSLNAYDRGIIIGTFYSNAGMSDAELLSEYINDEYQFDYLRFGKEGIYDFPPLWILGRLPNTTAGQMAIEEEVRGLVLSVANGWSSSLVAIGEAYLALRQKRAKMIITGGTDNQLDSEIEVELLCDGLLASENVGIPFSNTSDGYTFTSVGGMLVLETKEDSLISGDVDIVGYTNRYIGNIKALNNDEIAREMENCMMQVFEENEIDVLKIGFIQASAGGEQQLDLAEAVAIQKVFGSSVLVTCAQSYMGNTRAASGAVSTIFAYMQLKSGFIFPMPEGEEVLLNEMELRCSRKNPSVDGESYCLVNSFSPFGEMASIVLRYSE